MSRITWQNGKAYIPKIEFYINNTCNLTCTNCNRFNNYHFVGWQNFHDYKSELEQWKKYIDVGHIVIMGGEPLLNPSLLDWVTGLRKLWPDPGIQILTNGTRLSKNKDLYKKMLLDYSIFLEISWHNKHHKDLLLEQLQEFMTMPFNQRPSDKELDNAKTGDVLEFVDDENVKINAWVQDEFGIASIRNINGKYTLHNNNPIEAHNTCAFYLHGSYHMIKGKLYKCGPVALMPEFDEQHKLDISSDDRKLLNDYKALSVENFKIDSEKFFKEIDNVLPQCKFCPIGWENNPEIIYPDVKNKKPKQLQNN